MSGEQNTIEVGERDFADMLAELKFLRQQRDDLQERGSQFLAENRELRRDCGFPIRMMLLEFKVAMRQHIGVKPGNPLPPDAEIRLAAKIIAEEACEVLRSIFPDSETLEVVTSDLQAVCEFARIEVDMPALADGLADLDYVSEGARITFGIDGSPILSAVHEANMAKVAGGVREDGKRLKPPGWTPPDIVGELKKQGLVAP